MKNANASGTQGMCEDICIYFGSSLGKVYHRWICVTDFRKGLF